MQRIMNSMVFMIYIKRSIYHSWISEFAVQNETNVCTLIAKTSRNSLDCDDFFLKLQFKYIFCDHWSVIFSGDFLLISKLNRRFQWAENR